MGSVTPLAATQADAAAWFCLVLGTVVLLCGLVVGLWMSLKLAPAKARDAKAKLADAKTKVTQAKSQLEETSAAVGQPTFQALQRAAPAATQALTAAAESTESASTALEQVEGIVASLPENLRFAGLLVLVGTVLIGVATIQFGGVSLF